MFPSPIKPAVPTHVQHTRHTGGTASSSQAVEQRASSLTGVTYAVHFPQPTSTSRNTTSEFIYDQQPAMPQPRLSIPLVQSEGADIFIDRAYSPPRFCVSPPTYGRCNKDVIDLDICEAYFKIIHLSKKGKSNTTITEFCEKKKFLLAD